MSGEGEAKVSDEENAQLSDEAMRDLFDPYPSWTVSLVATQPRPINEDDREVPIAGAHLGERLAWVSLLGYGLFAEWGGSNMHPTAKRSLRICGILLGVMTKDDQ
jgi:hypothetical protein